MKKVTGRIIALCLVLELSFAWLGADVFSGSSSHTAFANTPDDRRFLLTDEQLMNNLFGNDLKQAQISLNCDVTLKENEKFNLSVNSPVEGKYQILIEYAIPEIKMFNCEIELSVNGNTVRSKLPSYWSDVLGQSNTDKFNNEVVPDQQRLSSKYYAYVTDTSSYSQAHCLFQLSKGDNTLTVFPSNQSVHIYRIFFVQFSQDVDYTEYVNSIASAQSGKDFVTIEAEDYRAKTDSFIRGRNVAGVVAYPNDSRTKLLNVIDDKSNKELGQQIVYEFEIKSAGLYKLAFKYSQPLKVGGASYRTIAIDGQTLFAQMRDVAFLHTGIDKYANKFFDGAEPYEIFLDAGIHTITFSVTAQKDEQYYKEIKTLVDEMNAQSIDIKRIRGSASDDGSTTDSHRTWDILSYIPDILDTIKGWETRLLQVYEGLRVDAKRAPSYASDLMLAVQNLRKLRSQPSKIPSRLSLLSDASSSACQLAASILTKLSEQNLSFDRFYIYSDTTVPSARKNFFQGMWYGIVQFFNSFSAEMNTDDSAKNPEALTVWVNRSSQYVEVLRELTAREFTKDSGIDVIFSIMPDENKLTLSNSTGSNPDVALGVSFYKPADFAIRGIAKNLLEYDGFIEWYASQYNLEALRPMTYQDGIYGASETQDFYVLFYRTDILQSLGLSVPDTWEDVKAMMPTLLRNAMNFCLPLATSITYKNFAMTSPFIYQNNGDYYTADGFRSDFNNPNTLKGIKESIDLYQVYGLQQNVSNFFNSFRSGSTPIGVANFGTYLQLQVAAPELAGKWNIALAPGTRQNDGNILRYQTADSNASMIFANTDKDKESYAFLKWWLSKDTQTTYANDLLRKYGRDYVWNTANIEAFKEMPYQQSHKKIIEEQFAWQKEVLRHPASYILEQEVSQMWIDVVVNRKQFQPRVDEAILRSDKEMVRKLTEFGFYDKDGNIVKTFNMNLIDQLKAKYQSKEANR